MKALVIGLGSMGKRRIRCLKSLGYENIVGFDVRDDRCNEVEQKLSVNTIRSASDLEFGKFDFVIISTPPDHHEHYMKKCLENGLHFFVEASVLDNDLESIARAAAAKNLVAAPSATLLYHPAIKMIHEIVRTEQLGQLTNYVYHSGQYLPDWHTYEKVNDYYVSKRETGGAREIVPFELSWIVRCFGWPKSVSGSLLRSGLIEGARDIDDTYNFMLNHGRILGSLVIDVMSRYATRRLTLVGSEGYLVWDWNEGNIKIFEGKSQSWKTLEYPKAPAAAGYNPNISEQMYIDEVAEFVAATKKSGQFRNTLDDDRRVLAILRRIEQSHEEGQRFEL